MVTLRSVVLGFVCVVFTAAFAPYNDFALGNTFFIGNHFPIGITLLMCVVILVVNPLVRWIRPQAALRFSEMTTVWAMCLVGAAFPTAGLLRQLIPWMVSPFYLLPHHAEWKEVLSFLPGWLFPTTNPGNDEIITSFFLGTPEGQPLAVPWSAWVKPAAMWALYFVPMFLGALLLSVLLSRQWIVHEKLQFPIVTVMLEMARDPEKGRRFNSLFRDRRVLLAAAVVMAIHLVNGLHTYFPKSPLIPLHYNMNDFFTEGFWYHFEWCIKRSGVYFCMVGITFVMASEVSLSLWLLFLVHMVIIAVLRYSGVDPYEAMRSQNYGAILAMGGYLLFLARSHLWRTIRVAFGAVRDQNDETYRGYRWVVRGLLLCIIASATWLCATGMPLAVALAQIVILYLVYLVMSRLVAETGLFFILPRMWAGNLFPLLLPNVISAKSYALSLSSSWPAFYNRETLMPFAFNALRLEHEAIRRESTTTGQSPVVRPSFLAALIAAMLVSLVVAGAVSIVLYYSRGAIRTNTWTAFDWCVSQCNGMLAYQRRLPLSPGQGPTHMAIGAGLIVVLGICRMRFPRWPLVPIALCMATSDALGYMWFSILIGWACKTGVMHLGGVSAYNRLRPLFLGMVIGEALMAGIWMAVGAVVSFSGHTIMPISILPG